MSDVRPNFLVVGAGKAGTTSLYNYLRQVGGVFLPSVKEPHYFVAPEVKDRIRICVQDEAEYFDLFAEGGSALWRGEMSVCYLYYSEQAIPRILSTLGAETKIGIMVRNPIERAYSAYLDVYRHNPDENLPFDEALLAEESRRSNNRLTPMMNYKDMGLYSQRVSDYMDAFESVHVMLADDLRADPVGVVRGFADFLGGLSVPDAFDLRIYNAGGRSWKNPALAAWIKAGATSRIRSAAKRVMPGGYGRLKELLFRSMMRSAAPVSPEVRAALSDFYREDVARLGDLIGRDLGDWLQ